jgi:hypothetical protein
MTEVKIPISINGLEEPKKHISVTRVQYALVNPENGHIHAWGGLDTICRVWEIEHTELDNSLKLEVRETNLVEIKTLSNEEIKKELMRQAKFGVKYH